MKRATKFYSIIKFFKTCHLKIKDGDSFTWGQAMTGILNEIKHCDKPLLNQAVMREMKDAIS